MGTPHPVSEYAPEDISTTGFASGISSSKPLAQGARLDASTALRNRTTTSQTAVPPDPSTPQHSPTADLQHTPESGGGSGDESKSAKPRRASLLGSSPAMSGRTTPVSVSRGTPPSFTAQGIRVGTARPSVGPATGLH